VSDLVENATERKHSDFCDSYDPPLYNIRARTKRAAENPKDLAEHGEIGNGRSRDSNQNLSSGENADYLTARIARDHPDVHEKMKREPPRAWMHPGGRA